MGVVTGQHTTINTPNFVGELFNIQPAETPFKNAAADNGIKRVQSKVFTWQTVDNADPAGTTGIAEGQDPTFAGRDRSEVANVVQIFQYGVEVNYSVLGATNTLDPTAGLTTSGIQLGVQPVGSEIEFQQMLKLDRASEDMEDAFLNGTLADAATRETDGLIPKITSNTVNAGGEVLLQSDVDELVRQMADSRAPFRRPTIFVNAHQFQQLTNIYGSALTLAPRSRTQGGQEIVEILIPVAGWTGVVYDRHVPVDTLLFADVSVLHPVVMPIPGKGELFLEPVARTGAAEKSQLYGEWGLQYGPEQWHGKITNLDDSDIS